MKCSLHKFFFSFLFLQFAFYNFLFSQPITFEKYYDFGWSEVGLGIISTYDGGYAIAGGQGITIGYSKAIVLKLDSLGNQEWVTFAGSVNDRAGNAIVQNPDSGYVMTGDITGSAPNEYDIYLLKLNKNGDTAWAKFYNGVGTEGVSDIKRTFDNGYILAGYTAITGTSTTSQVYFLRTNSLGDTLWTRMRSGNETASARSVIQTQDSGYAIFGTSSNPGTSYPSQSFYLIKYDKDGNFLWEKFYEADSSRQNHGYSVQELTNGDLILGGIVYYTLQTRWDIYIIRTDAQGNEVWAKSYGTNNEEDVYSICINTIDSSIIITGTYWLPVASPASNVLLMKITQNSDSLWSRLYGGNVNSIGFHIISDSDGGFVITGERSNTPTNDIYVIKTDSIGCVVPGCDTIPFPYTHVVLNDEKYSFSIYPNPASGQVTIRLRTTKIALLNISILDITGREVLTLNELFNSSDNEIKIKTSNLKSGVYFIKIMLNNELLKTEKIIINNQ